MLGFGEPGPAGGEGLLGALRGCGVAPFARLGQLLLQLGDGRAQLSHRPLGPRQRFGIRPVPLRLFGLAYGVLDPPEPGLQVFPGVPRHRPDLLPSFLDAAQRRPGGADIGDRQQSLGLIEQLLLGLGVLAQLSVLGREDLRTGVEELVLGRPEALPQLGLGIPVCSSGRFPQPHQLAVRAGGRAPVGGPRQGLGVGDQLLLAGLDVLAFRLQGGEIRLAPLGEGVAGRGQPLPQDGFGRPFGVRRRLPLLEQLAHPLAAALPVGGFGGDLLRLGHDPLLDLLRLHARLLAGRLGLFAAVADVLDQALDPGAEPVQVAERVGLVNRLDQAINAGRGLGGSDVGARDPLLEQHDLGLKRLVLALEEGDRLFRTSRLPRADHPLAVGGTDIDRPVGVYPAPRMVGGRHGEPPALVLLVLGFLDRHAVNDDLFLRSAALGLTRHGVLTRIPILGHILDDTESR